MRIPTFSSVLGLALLLGLGAAGYTLVRGLPRGIDRGQLVDGPNRRSTRSDTLEGNPLNVRRWLRQGERLASEGEPVEPLWDRWRTLTERAVATTPSDREAWYAVGWSRRQTGDEAGAAKAWAHALAMVEAETDPRIVYDRGCLRALLGDTDGALADLEAAVATGAIPTRTVVSDPDLAGLCDDPRFQAIVEQLPPSDEPTQT